jgi:hypothetical protein
MNVERRGLAQRLERMTNRVSPIMQLTVLYLALLLLAPAPIPLPAARTASGTPVRLIFDTDMSGDCDDAGALALLHALADRGECELLATVVNRKDLTGASAAATDAINTFYGRPNLSLGTDKQGPTALQRTSDSPGRCAMSSPTTSAPMTARRTRWMCVAGCWQRNRSLGKLFAVAACAWMPAATQLGNAPREPGNPAGA